MSEGKLSTRKDSLQWIQDKYDIPNRHLTARQWNTNDVAEFIDEYLKEQCEGEKQPDTEVRNRTSWTYFDDEHPSEGYVAITDGKVIELCKCWLGVDGELNYNSKQLTEYLAWSSSNELYIGLNCL